MISKVYADLSEVLPTMYHFCIQSSRGHRTRHVDVRRGAQTRVQTRGGTYYNPCGVCVDNDDDGDVGGEAPLIKLTPTAGGPNLPISSQPFPAWTT